MASETAEQFWHDRFIEVNALLHRCAVALDLAIHMLPAERVNQFLQDAHDQYEQYMARLLQTDHSTEVSEAQPAPVEHPTEERP